MTDPWSLTELPELFDFWRARCRRCKYDEVHADRSKALIQVSDHFLGAHTRLRRTDPYPLKTSHGKPVAKVPPRWWCDECDPNHSMTAKQAVEHFLAEHKEAK